jgi:hypothetical protein
METPMDRFLSRVRHDLVKRMLWAARDRRDLGGPVMPGELVATILDDEGHPTSPRACFAGLCEDVEGLDPGARERFAAALDAAAAAARADDLTKVLALEAAFEDLARTVKKGTHDAPNLGD